MDREGDDPRPCCLAEVDCPFLDWGEIDRLLGALGAPRPGAGLGFGQALRALTASVYQRRRALGQRPTASDVEPIVRFLLRGD